MVNILIHQFQPGGATAPIDFSEGFVSGAGITDRLGEARWMS
jgi:hypothetical protein